MYRKRTCGDCRYLTRTSPEQRFLLCEFWAAKPYPVKYAEAFVTDRKHGISGRDFAQLHCHVTPDSAPCLFFEQRRTNGLLLPCH